MHATVKKRPPRRMTMSYGAEVRNIHLMARAGTTSVNQIRSGGQASDSVNKHGHFLVARPIEVGCQIVQR